MMYLNKDENVHRLAVRGDSLGRERVTDDRERQKA